MIALDWQAYWGTFFLGMLSLAAIPVVLRGAGYMITLLKRSI
jgi:hypothetical protein